MINISTQREIVVGVGLDKITCFVLQFSWIDSTSLKEISSHCLSLWLFLSNSSQAVENTSLRFILHVPLYYMLLYIIAIYILHSFPYSCFISTSEVNIDLVDNPIVVKKITNYPWCYIKSKLTRRLNPPWVT